MVGWATQGNVDLTVTAAKHDLQGPSLPTNMLGASCC